jgi:hypothetical protein
MFHSAAYANFLRTNPTGSLSARDQKRAQKNSPALGKSAQDGAKDCVVRRPPGVDGGSAYETRTAGVVHVAHAASANAARTGMRPLYQMYYSAK